MCNNSILILNTCMNKIILIISFYHLLLSSSFTYFMSGPISECRLSSARACALVKLVVDSSLMDRMQSPTPIRPSRLIEPPWITLRTTIPKPSLLELTVIPIVKTHETVNVFEPQLWVPR